jgi:hypothetical protein
MWADTPEIRYSLARQRQAELRAQAGVNRICWNRPVTDRADRFWGLRLHVGSFLLVVGRTLREDETRLLKPTH